MLNSTLKAILILIIYHSALQLQAQPDQGLFIPRDILEAYESSCRDYSGNPGINYFQCRSDYEIEATFDPVNKVLSGRERILYHNNSPDHLHFIVLRLYPEVYRKGAVRGRAIHPEDAGKGMEILSLQLNGKSLDLNNSAHIPHSTGTLLFLRSDIAPGEKAVLRVDWKNYFPYKTHERFGPVGDSSYFVAYWYPQISVYDDINGWDIYDWDNHSEMYTNYGDFRLSLELPENYIAWATGELKNPAETLSDKLLQRFNKSKEEAKTVDIVTKSDLKQKKLTQAGSNIWVFEASDVNDFAFAVSNEHLWSAFSYRNGEKNTHVHIPYLPSSVNFGKVPEISRWLLDQFRDQIPGIVYPYPSLTVFNGADGMEFPMIMNNAEEPGIGGTWFLTAHEVCHTFFPFLVGTNQKRHGWIDEGLVTMMGVELHSQKTAAYDFRELYLDYYPQIAGTQEDIPSMVNSFYLPDILFQQHEYVRPGMAFWVLKDILGDDLFYQCLKEFIIRWEGKHPTPYDLFFTFNSKSGENLNWFWQPWFLEFAWPDLEILKVEEIEGKGKIHIRNKGGMPFPSKLRIYGENDKEIQVLKIDARVWKDNNLHLIDIPENIMVKKFVLDTENYPDTNIENNIWRR